MYIRNKEQTRALFKFATVKAQFEQSELKLTKALQKFVKSFFSLLITFFISVV